MSLAVSQIIEDIETNADKWKPIYSGGYLAGIMKNNTEVKYFGNMGFLAASYIKIRGKVIKTSYTDNINLEKAVMLWSKKFCKNSK